MYTEKSVELKNDFYSRFGESEGELCFERVGVPCVLMDCGSHALAFSLGCGVRAYGRKYGDVLRILNDRSNVCDVHYMKSGYGAQILYSADVPGLAGMNEATAYAIEKLLRRMEIAEKAESAGSTAAICDRYGSGGWCAYAAYDEIKEIPLPLTGYNAILVRTKRNQRGKADHELLQRFCLAEKERIIAAAEGLKRCRIEVLFDMLNESENAAEFLLGNSEEIVTVVKIACRTDGVRAVKACDNGVLCFVEKERTDHAVHTIRNEFVRRTGFSAGVLIVK